MFNMNVRPSEICYTQDSIGNTFNAKSRHRNTMIGETLDDICEKRCSIEDIPTMSVAFLSGKLQTADNRRLWLFRQLELLGKCDTIRVKKIRSIPLFKRTSNTDGQYIRVRGGGPGGYWHTIAEQKAMHKSKQDDEHPLRRWETEHDVNQGISNIEKEAPTYVFRSTETHLRKLSIGGEQFARNPTEDVISRYHTEHKKRPLNTISDVTVSKFQTQTSNDATYGFVHKEQDHLQVDSQYGRQIQASSAFTTATLSNKTMYYSEPVSDDKDPIFKSQTVQEKAQEQVAEYHFRTQILAGSDKAVYTSTTRSKPAMSFYKHVYNDKEPISEYRTVQQKHAEEQIAEYDSRRQKLAGKAISATKMKQAATYSGSVNDDHKPISKFHGVEKKAQEQSAEYHNRTKMQVASNTTVHTSAIRSKQAASYTDHVNNNQTPISNSWTVQQEKAHLQIAQHHSLSKMQAVSDNMSYNEPAYKDQEILSKFRTMQQKRALQQIGGYNSRMQVQAATNATINATRSKQDASCSEPLHNDQQTITKSRNIQEEASKQTADNQSSIKINAGIDTAEHTSSIRPKQAVSYSEPVYDGQKPISKYRTLNMDNKQLSYNQHRTNLQTGKDTTVYSNVRLSKPSVSYFKPQERKEEYDFRTKMHATSDVGVYTRVTRNNADYKPVSYEQQPFENRTHEQKADNHYSTQMQPTTVADVHSSATLIKPTASDFEHVYFDEKPVSKSRTAKHSKTREQIVDCQLRTQMHAGKDAAVNSSVIRSKQAASYSEPECDVKINICKSRTVQKTTNEQLADNQSHTQMHASPAASVYTSAVGGKPAASDIEPVPSNNRKTNSESRTVQLEAHKQVTEYQSRTQRQASSETGLFKSATRSKNTTFDFEPVSYDQPTISKPRFVYKNPELSVLIVAEDTNLSSNRHAYASSAATKLIAQGKTKSEPTSMTKSCRTRANRHASQAPIKKVFDEVNHAQQHTYNMTRSEGLKPKSTSFYKESYVSPVPNVSNDPMETFTKSKRPHNKTFGWQNDNKAHTALSYQTYERNSNDSSIQNEDSDSDNSIINLC